jgi:hypothetical protein
MTVGDLELLELGYNLAGEDNGIQNNSKISKRTPTVSTISD